LLEWKLYKHTCQFAVNQFLQLKTTVMKLNLITMLFFVSTSSLLLAACKKNDTTDSPCDRPATGAFNADVQNAELLKLGVNVPAQWYALGIKLSRTTPNQSIAPINARAFGYMGVALYESIVPGLSDYKSLQGQLNQFQAVTHISCGEKYFYPACANAALANMVHLMFGNTSPAQNFTIDSLEKVTNTLFASTIPKGILDRSIAFGKAISNDVYKWSVSDGGDKAYLNPYPATYTPPVGTGLWVPQTGQLAQLPYWGSIRTFVKANATVQSAAPPAYSTDPSSGFYKEELEVYNESINQDPEHIIIAKYWAALPGPCVSISILSSVLANEKADLSVAAEAYCKVGMATADALICCYKTKYQYNQERPITFIRANFNSTWVSLLPTPPFPDYTSAHSAQAGASARVLADIFGDNTTFTDNSINSLGFTPRTFTKFSDCAIEVGLSRLYGGIHVRTSNFVGLDQGNLVGMHVSALHFKRNY
jgi:hypothetical protein